MKITCKQNTYLLSKKEEGKTSIMENLQIFFHNLYCGPCRRFLKQIKLMSKSFSKLNDQLSNSPFAALSDEKKAELEKMIRSENSLK